MLSETVTIVCLSILVYTLSLFFLPALVLVILNGSITLAIFFIVSLLPFFFMIFLGVFKVLFAYYHRTKKQPGKAFLAIQKVGFPLLRFWLMTDRIPQQPESDYAYSKKLNRLYLNNFSLYSGVVLLLSSIVGFSVSTLFNSILPIMVFGIRYTYFEALAALWVLWILIVIAQNAVYHGRVYNKDFE